MEYLSFCAWLIAFNIMSFRFIHIINDRISFFLNAVVISHYTYIVFTVFYNSHNNLHFHQQRARVPFSQHPHKHFFFISLIIAIHSGVRYLLVVIICILLMIVMLSLFSYTCWPFVHLLRNVSSDPLSNFKPGFLLSSWVPYIYIHTHTL